MRTVRTVRGKHSHKRFAIAERNERSVCGYAVTDGKLMLHWPIGGYKYNRPDDTTPESDFPLHTNCGRCGYPIEAVYNDRNRYGSLIWRTPEYIIEEVPW